MTCLRREIEIIERTRAARKSPEGMKGGRSSLASCSDWCRKGLVGNERPSIEAVKLLHKIHHLLLFTRVSPYPHLSWSLNRGLERQIKHDILWAHTPITSGYLHSKKKRELVQRKRYLHWHSEVEARAGFCQALNKKRRVSESLRQDHSLPCWPMCLGQSLLLSRHLSYINIKCILRRGVESKKCVGLCFIILVDESEPLVRVS